MRLRHLLKPILFTGFSLIVTLVQPGVVAGATEMSWLNGTPQISIEEAVPMAEPCRNEMITVVLIEPRNGKFTAETEGCVTTGADLDIATYGISGQWGVAVRYHSDSYFHHISLSSTTASLAPGTNIFVYKDYSGNYQSLKLTTVSDLAIALEPVITNEIGLVSVYGIKSSQATAWMPFDDPVGANHDTYSYTISSNGRFVLAYVDYKGFVKIDLITGVVTKIYTMRSSWYSGPDSPVAQSISDDGRYAYVGMGAMMIDTKDCGDSFGQGFDYMSDLSNPCELTNLTEIVRASLGHSFSSTKSRFIDGGSGIEFESALYPGRQWYGDTGPPKHITLHVAGFVPSARLDYLALGDSYTSGEGDIEKKDGVNFYTPVTDYKDGCHLSTRSYPFLLRDYWHIPSSKMQSVACSGARVVQDYTSRPETYKGQGGRLANLTDQQRNNAQSTALDKFIPGKVPQLEFVKKYKPKVITLTGGGNDIGFGDIIKYCALSLEPCGWAVDGEMKDNLMWYIDDQYHYNKHLIDDIKSVSPDSKVYIVGYPRFIADSGICGLNTALLDGLEMKFINNSVTRLNDVLKRVAQDSGATYLNIEDSLNGGRICEGYEYVTGFFSGYISSRELQDSNMFHPNSEGHKKMAASIEQSWREKQQSGNNVDSIIQYDTPTITRKIVRFEVAPNTIKVGRSMNIAVGLGTFSPQSSVLVKIQSEPTDLGTLMVDDSGAIVAGNTITIPADFQPGYHLLSIIGSSMSGEPIEIQQFISIQSSNEDDSDGDGILNNVDYCPYVKSWYDDAGANMCVAPLTTTIEHNDNSESEVALKTPEKTSPNTQIGLIYASSYTNILGDNYTDEKIDNKLPNLKKVEAVKIPSTANGSIMYWPWITAGVTLGALIIGFGIYAKNKK